MRQLENNKIVALFFSFFALMASYLFAQTPPSVYEVSPSTVCMCSLETIYIRGFAMERGVTVDCSEDIEVIDVRWLSRSGLLLDTQVGCGILEGSRSISVTNPDFFSDTLRNAIYIQDCSDLPPPDSTITLKINNINPSEFPLISLEIFAGFGQFYYITGLSPMNFNLFEDSINIAGYESFIENESTNLIDFVICFDNSGSMYDYVYGVVNEFPWFQDSLDRYSFDTRYGLATFIDYVSVYEDDICGNLFQNRYL